MNSGNWDNNVRRAMPAMTTELGHAYAVLALRLLAMSSLTYAFSAMNARQPPQAEMSRAPPISAGSTMKPLMPRPSARRTVPIDNGGGIAATNFPNAEAFSVQTSRAIDDPVPAATRSMPGF